MNEPAPLMIIGLDNMAKVLGVSRGKLRSEYLKRRDFPARREESGSWVSTRQSLAAWAENYVNSPDRQAI